jgi:phosphoglycerate kinase
MAVIDTKVRVDIQARAHLHAGGRPIRSVRQAAVADQRVLVRADLNVPLEDGRVADETRIRAALPTLEFLRERGAAMITVCSHLGRPRGADPALSIRPVANRLRELFAGPLTVLENTRFDPGETTNDPSFAQELARDQDLFVEDAFGSAHREHASTVGVAALLPTYAGLLLERELEHLARLRGPVERPFVIVVGGANADEKQAMLAQLGVRADAVLVGGRLAGRLRVANPLPFAVELPLDVIGANRLAETAHVRQCTPEELPYGWLEVDIGPRTREHFAGIVAGAKTIFWNGPLGAFEWPLFAEGTRAIAEAVAEADAYSVVGGADSLRALNQLGLGGSISFASTGGGASLAFLEDPGLPAVAVIPSAA